MSKTQQIWYSDNNLNETNKSNDNSFDESDHYSDTSSINVDENNYDNAYDYNINEDDYDEYHEYNDTLRRNSSPVINNIILEKDIGSIDELNRIQKKHKNDIFKRTLSHCIEKKKLKSSTLNVDDLIAKKEKINDIINTNTNRLMIRQSEKQSKEDDKIVMIDKFESQFVDKSLSPRGLYMLNKDRPNLEKAFNKTILEINNIIDRLDNSINGIIAEIDKDRNIFNQFSSEISNIDSKNKKMDRILKKMDTDFQIDMIDFNKNFSIWYEDFAKSQGWVFITINRNKSPYEIINKNHNINDNKMIQLIVKDVVESVVDSVIDTDSDNNPTSPDKCDGNAFKILPLEQPVPPSMPVPVMRPIVPIIAKSDYGMKPCNNGNTCIKKDCRFLHPPKHTIADGRKNKNELERLERIRFEDEMKEYNYNWDKYEYDLELWKKQDMLQSIEAFPALGR
jgi:hypothetical protein